MLGQKLFLFCISFLVCSIFSLPVDQFNNENDKLEKVIMIHRHGDRSPLKTYPKDPYRDPLYWPDGWGELTLKGKQRMYSVGRYMRRRYSDFLGKSPHEVLIRSSGSDRCLQSTSLILAGLYPPQGRWKWNEDLGTLWQPFPIQTVPHPHDSMLNPDSVCTNAKEEIDKIYSSDMVQSYRDSVKATLKYVEMNSGLENINLISAEELFDTILIEKLNNLNLPAWVDTSVYEKLYEIMNKTFVFSGLTRRIQRFRAGNLIKDFLNKIEDSKKFGHKRLLIYSTHDTQLSVFLSALNIYDGFAPPFGATIFIELYRNPQDIPYLKLFYLSDTESEMPQELPLNDCLLTNYDQTEGKPKHQKTVCTLKRFKIMVEDLLPDNWDVECGNSVSSGYSDPEAIIPIYISSIALMIVIMILVMFLYLFLKNRRNMIFYKMLPIN